MRRAVGRDELDAPLVELELAVGLVRQHTPTLGIETISTREAHGRVLAHDVRSPIDVPAFDNAAMDGYAVRSHDFIDAGEHRPIALDTTVRIATGAPIPEGYDAVVPWEATGEHEGEIVVRTPITNGQHVRPCGAELRADDIALLADTPLRAPHVGVLRAAGLEQITVVRTPRVSIAATGDEIVAVGQPLSDGQIYSSNDCVLHAIVTAAGARVGDMQLLRDDPIAIDAWMLAAAQASDIVITTGGASVGERDWTRTALQRLGEIHFWHVDVKPGKPIAFGTIENTSVFVLPGNPGAVFACAQTFVVPALSKLQGRPFDENRFVGTLLQDVIGDRRRNVLQPVTLQPGTGGIMPLSHGSSQLLGPFLDAEALAIIPAGGARRGDTVSVQLIIG